MRRLPESVKTTQGTLRKDRQNVNMPTPKQGIPPAPAHLSDGAKALWATLAEQLGAAGILTEVDALALESLVESYADLRLARESLASHGGATVYECSTKSGDRMFRQFPEVRQIADADRRVREWLARFGLTPADRARVSAQPAKSEDSPWAKFRKAEGTWVSSGDPEMDEILNARRNDIPKPQ